MTVIHMPNNKQRAANVEAARLASFLVNDRYTRTHMSLIQRIASFQHYRGTHARILTGG